MQLDAVACRLLAGSGQQQASLHEICLPLTPVVPTARAKLEDGSESDAVGLGGQAPARPSCSISVRVRAPGDVGSLGGMYSKGSAEAEGTHVSCVCAGARGALILT